MDLKTLKAQAGKLSDVAKELKEKEKTKYSADERFFKPTKDDAGNINCIIRFLPQSDFSKSPYVKKYSHYIKVSGKTFVCACMNEGSKEGGCPVCAEARPYWDEYWAVRNAHGKEHPGCKEALKGANRFGANQQIVTNIMVVKNPAKPETEGKVFLYSMPKAVYDKYSQKLFPKDEMDEQVIIHNPFTGRNFKLSAYTKKVSEDQNFLQYDGSYFYDKAEPISDNEEKIVQVMNDTYDLEAYIKETKVDKEDINKRFNEFKKYLGVKTETAVSKKVEVPVVQEEEVVEESTSESVGEDIIEEVDIDDIDDLFGDD